jgi:hypothetical protein
MVKSRVFHSASLFVRRQIMAQTGVLQERRAAVLRVAVSRAKNEMFQYALFDSTAATLAFLRFGKSPTVNSFTVVCFGVFLPFAQVARAHARCIWRGINKRAHLHMCRVVGIPPKRSKEVSCGSEKGCHPSGAMPVLAI